MTTIILLLFFIIASYMLLRVHILALELISMVDKLLECTENLLDLDDFINDSIERQIRDGDKKDENTSEE